MLKLNALYTKYYYFSTRYLGGNYEDQLYA